LGFMKLPSVRKTFDYRYNPMTCIQPSEEKLEVF
jgi:hypothetical protein